MVAVPDIKVAESASAQESIETRASWVAAGIVLFILTFSYGAPLLAVVALKPIAADLGNARSIPSLAYSLAWLGSGAGAMAFGWIAERFGIARTVVFGAVMMGAGLALASVGGPWELLVGHGLLVGILGGGAINVPLIVYISALVRPAPRLGGGAGLERPVHRRRALAAVHRAGDRAFRLAVDHAGVRRRDRAGDRARGADLPAASAGDRQRCVGISRADRATGAWPSRPPRHSPCFVSPGSCAARPWRCRRRTSSRSAPTWGSRRRGER